jgi:hypothetical protein
MAAGVTSIIVVSTMLVSRSVDRLSRQADPGVQPAAHEIGRCAPGRGVATLIVGA